MFGEKAERSGLGDGPQQPLVFNPQHPEQGDGGQRARDVVAGVVEKLAQWAGLVGVARVLACVCSKTRKESMNERMNQIVHMRLNGKVEMILGQEMVDSRTEGVAKARGTTCRRLSRDASRKTP